MNRNLPPLGSLRAFEAVARRLSFSKAAQDLHVTPGAVSQQIRVLEEALGEKLFERTRRSVALTETAMQMLPDVQSGLETLRRAFTRTSTVTENSLAISVAPSFASKWLMPRLAQFSRRHPEIDLRISATVALTDFKRDKVDLAIRLGRGDYPNLHSERLFGEALAPLCAPSLLKSKRDLKKPGDLSRHHLLHDTSIPGENDRPAWERWLELAGASGVPARRGTRFSLAELAMQAAIDGSGVVLGRLALAESDLATGRLVRPFKPILPLEVSYYLVMPKGNVERQDVKYFRDWLFGSLKPTSRHKNRRLA
jgi:LysR family glycine cleavage system transcriptional activator